MVPEFVLILSAATKSFCAGKFFCGGDAGCVGCPQQTAPRNEYKGKDSRQGYSTHECLAGKRVYQPFFLRALLLLSVLIKIVALPPSYKCPLRGSITTISSTRLNPSPGWWPRSVLYDHLGSEPGKSKITTFGLPPLNECETQNDPSRRD
jgi:hypothetical protein